VLKALLRDRLFCAAILAAQIVIVILYLVLRPPIEFDWIGREPLRFAIVMVVYPVLEEIVFRGWLQQSLRKRIAYVIAGITAANILTSIVFTLFHFINHRPVWAAAVIIPSIIFGYFRDKYESVMPSIVLHIIYNMAYFIPFGIGSHIFS
jgi:membrane protease YdiL (CAAX protease family)